MSIESYLWGINQGYEYRRFTMTRIHLGYVTAFRTFAIIVMTFWLAIRFTYGELFDQFKYFTTWGSYF